MQSMKRKKLWVDIAMTVCLMLLIFSGVSRTRTRVLWGLGQRLSKQKPITSASAEMGGFGVCITDALLVSFVPRRLFL